MKMKITIKINKPILLELIENLREALNGVLDEAVQELEEE